MVDGTHISLAAPFGTPADNHNRKGLFSKNLQVVDWTMRIRDMCVGWPDSVHDARVCTHSTAYRLASLLPYGLFVLERCCSAYPLRTYLPKPLKNIAMLATTILTSMSPTLSVFTWIQLTS